MERSIEKAKNIQDKEAVLQQLEKQEKKVLEIAWQSFLKSKEMSEEEGRSLSPAENEELFEEFWKLSSTQKIYKEFKRFKQPLDRLIKKFAKSDQESES
ncbi:hypothetical protein MYX06_01375 [Patescibacteria group bacterium AH-259-L05]|nr:hypothetical protein [Patescibacteria group bacterium AH-259-L05]